MPEWSLPAAIDAVTEVAPEREMIVWTDARGPSIRRTYAEVQDRTRRLAAFFHAHGIGLQRERSEMERWECGQSPVALVLSNGPEYIEAMLGAYRARAVPFNVNHHYNAAEVASLLSQIGARAVVYHRRLAPLLRGLDPSVVVLHVEDGSDEPVLPGSVAYETAIAESDPHADLAAPSPDDLYLVCTGGTTGLPKGVLWRQGDIYIATMGGAEDATTESMQARAAHASHVWFAAPPLMHAAAQWTVFSALHNGGTVVLHDDAAPFAPSTILDTAAREHVNLLTIVGDAYARPIVEELRARPYDLPALQQIATGGAMTSPVLKQALLELVPHLMIVDGYGASETGGMAYAASTKNGQTQEFRGGADAIVLSEDRTRVLEPGADEMGWTARVGRVPLGYLNDRDATERTFPVVDGQRYAVPGDRATVGADGGITLFGRDSMVVNSGGEKIFVEEVEEAVRRHPDVLDALVVGRPSVRFGEEVVALVQCRPGASVTGADIRAFAIESVSRFKAPRAVLFCDQISRHPSGKADYRWAREVATDATEVG